MRTLIPPNTSEIQSSDLDLEKNFRTVFVSTTFSGEPFFDTQQKSGIGCFSFLRGSMSVFLYLRRLLNLPKSLSEKGSPRRGTLVPDRLWNGRQNTLGLISWDNSTRTWWLGTFDSIIYAQQKFHNSHTIKQWVLSFWNVPEKFVKLSGHNRVGPVPMTGTEWPYSRRGP